MAPERFQGRCDSRSDIYSLGITLYEILARRPAFTESDRSKLLLLVTTTNPPSLRSLDASIPRDLETIVLKAMARDPADRYQTAGALAEDLSRFLSDRPILRDAARRSSRPGGGAGATPRWPRSWRFWRCCWSAWRRDQHWRHSGSIGWP